MEVIIKGKQGEGKTRGAHAFAESWAETNGLTANIAEVYAPFRDAYRIHRDILSQSANVVIFEGGRDLLDRAVTEQVVMALGDGFLIIYTVQEV